MKRLNFVLMAVALCVMFTACQKEKMENDSIPEQNHSAPIGVPPEVLPDVGALGEEDIEIVMKAPAASFPAPDLNGVVNLFPDPGGWPTLYFDIINEYCASMYDDHMYCRFWTRQWAYNSSSGFYLVRGWHIINSNAAPCYSYMEGRETLYYAREIWTQGVVQAWAWTGSEWEGPVQSDVELLYTYPGM